MSRISSVRPGTVGLFSEADRYDASTSKDPTLQGW